MQDFLEFITEQSSKGTYIAVSLDEASQQSVRELATSLNIPNLIDPEEYHSTIVFSRKWFDPGFEQKKVDYKATITGYTIFTSEDGQKAFVLKVDSPELTLLHEHYKEVYGATFDYDEYTTHITLSYDSGEVADNLNIPSIQITYNLLYSQELDLDWKNKVKLEGDS